MESCAPNVVERTVKTGVFSNLSQGVDRRERWIVGLPRAKRGGVPVGRLRAASGGHIVFGVDLELAIHLGVEEVNGLGTRGGRSSPDQGDCASAASFAFG